MAQSPDEAHYKIIADRILAGAVVLFLGAGVNLCGRQESERFEPGRGLPCGSELAAYLASKVGGFPGKDPTDLLRVSQYVVIVLGLQPLYQLLHGVFDAEYQPTPVHKLLASLPSLIRARPSIESKYPLIVTTNYDDALEKAFESVGEKYDLVTYIADGPNSGRFVHTNPDGDERIINKPKTYKELQCNEHPVIAKIHGAVVRQMPKQDSFVITENHYIDYLSHTDIKQLIPVNMASRMMQSHFLFLGYSLNDWNLRVILRRLWGDAELGWKSWAVQLNPDSIDEKSWSGRGVELLDIGLEEYIELLGAALTSAARVSGELS